MAIPINVEYKDDGKAEAILYGRLHGQAEKIPLLRLSADVQVECPVLPDAKDLEEMRQDVIRLVDKTLVKFAKLFAEALKLFQEKEVAYRVPDRPDQPNQSTQAAAQAEAGPEA